MIHASRKTRKQTRFTENYVHLGAQLSRARKRKQAQNRKRRIKRRTGAKRQRSY